MREENGVAAPAANLERDITTLCQACANGDQDAMSKLFGLLYQELQTIAHAHRRKWQGNQTLNTTALIHETYLKLVGSTEHHFSGRGHFYATAAKAMRHILINYAQQRATVKRGGHVEHTDRIDDIASAVSSTPELLALHQALEKLETSHPRRSSVVECRIFGGMTNQQIGSALGISAATVKRDWTLAQAELYQLLEPLTEPKSSQTW